MVLNVQLISAETFKKDQIHNVGSGELMVITPDEQEAIARLGEDWLILNSANQELKKQNSLLMELLSTQKKQLEIAEQLLLLEKDRVAFYKEMFEMERENHKRDVELLKQIIADQRELIKAAKPSWIERFIPLVGMIATIVAMAL